MFFLCGSISVQYLQPHILRHTCSMEPHPSLPLLRYLFYNNILKHFLICIRSQIESAYEQVQEMMVSIFYIRYRTSLCPTSFHTPSLTHVLSFRAAQSRLCMLNKNIDSSVRGIKRSFEVNYRCALDIETNDYQGDSLCRRYNLNSWIFPFYKPALRSKKFPALFIPFKQFYETQDNENSNLKKK